MGTGSPIQTCFNAGELTPRLHGRIDMQVYRDGCATMHGWLPTVQGAAVAAPGTVFVNVAKGPFRAIPFEYDVTQGYVIEASAATFRFYTNDVRLDDGDDPIEVATPWTYDQVRALDYQQSRDVLYLMHPDTAPQTLTRTDATTFTLADLDLQNGPFEDGNSDESITVSVDATTGSVTITASAAIFAATDVGGLFEIEAHDYHDVKSWEPHLKSTNGDKRWWDTRVYQNVSSGDRWTGSNPPVHDRGTEWDGSLTKDVNDKGPYGVEWEFLYGRIGRLRITGFTSDTEVTATVLKRLPDSLTATASWRWAFGAFSETRGWPSKVAIWRERLVLAKDDRLYGSVTGGYPNFEARDSSGFFQRDLEFNVLLRAPEPIQWLMDDGRLVVGTRTSVYAIDMLDLQTGTAGPPVLKAGKPSNAGAKAAKAIFADDQIVYIQNAGTKLLALDDGDDPERYKPIDLTLRAEHLGHAGFVEIAWQQEPERHLWAVRGDGTLVALTWSREQQVQGWSRRTLGGGMLARTATTISAPDGTWQQLWIGAEAGEDWWMVRMTPMWRTGDAQADAWFVDAGLAYSGDAVASGGGAEHLAGESVQVLADGKPHPDITIGEDGSWAIGYPASKVTLGFGFPAVLTLLPIEAGGEDGTAQGKLKKIPEVTLRLLETQGVRISVQDADITPVELRVPANAMDQAVPLMTGDYRATTTGTLGERQGQITIERFQPTPATLLAVMPKVVAGAR